MSPEELILRLMMAVVSLACVVGMVFLWVKSNPEDNVGLPVFLLFILAVGAGISATKGVT